MYLIAPSSDLFFIFCIQMYFEAIHLKMKINPLLLRFRDIGVQKHQTISTKYIDVNVKRRFLTHFPGI